MLMSSLGTGRGQCGQSWQEQGKQVQSQGAGWCWGSMTASCPAVTRSPSALLSMLCPGALLEKKVDMDKRGLGMTDYNGMVTKPLGCRPPISKESSMDRPTFLDKVWI